MVDDGSHLFEDKVMETSVGGLHTLQQELLLRVSRGYRRIIEQVVFKLNGSGRYWMLSRQVASTADCPNKDGPCC